MGARSADCTQIVAAADGCLKVLYLRASGRLEGSQLCVAFTVMQASKLDTDATSHTARPSGPAPAKVCYALT